MEKIRDLKCMDINGTKDASLWINDYGKVFYDNGVDIIPYREIGHLYGCESCIHFRDKSYKEDFTQNNFYHLNPLNYPPVCKCHILDKKYENYDITFRCGRDTNKHPVCKNFRINSDKNIGDDYNINHFVNMRNSCIFGEDNKIAINGISYQGKQAPFTFYVDKTKWQNLDFIDGYCVEMINPLRWDMFNFNGEEYRGFEKYIELYGVPNNMTKFRFKKEWDLLGKPNRCGNFIGIFDFNIMWFKEI